MNNEKDIIIMDLEYTAWEGNNEHWWREDLWQYKEIIQIGAVRTNSTFSKKIDSFSCFVKPKINFVLSEYIKNLTKISQEDIDTKWIDFFEAIDKFISWSCWLPIYSYWNDFGIIKHNFELYKKEISFPNEFYDIKDTFKKYWIDSNKFNSWTINRAVWLKTNFVEHDALWDVNNIIDTLNFLNKNNNI